jgi:hypothetical protein
MAVPEKSIVSISFVSVIDNRITYYGHPAHHRCCGGLNATSGSFIGGLENKLHSQ